jgi:predicted PurR-regulated permease PerM
VGDTTPSTSWWKAPLIGAGALALALGLLVVIWLLARPIALLFATIIIAEALAPAVDWLECRMQRVAGLVLLYLGIFIIVILMSWLVIPPLIDQAQEIVSRAPALIGILRNVLDQFAPAIGERLAQVITSQLSRLVGVLVTRPFTVLSYALEIVFVVSLSVYWLMIAPRLRRFVLSLFPPSNREKASDVLRQMGGTMGDYVRGVVIDAVIMGALAFVGLFVIGVNNPLLLGVITMLGEFVPIIGPIVATVPIVLIALTQQ